MVESHSSEPGTLLHCFPHRTLIRCSLKVQIFLAFVQLNTPNALPHLLFCVIQSKFAMWKDTVPVKQRKNPINQRNIHPR